MVGLVLCADSDQVDIVRAVYIFVINTVILQVSILVRDTRSHFTILLLIYVTLTLKALKYFYINQSGFFLF